MRWEEKKELILGPTISTNSGCRGAGSLTIDREDHNGDSRKLLCCSGGRNQLLFEAVRRMNLTKSTLKVPFGDSRAQACQFLAEVITIKSKRNQKLAELALEILRTRTDIDISPVLGFVRGNICGIPTETSQRYHRGRQESRVGEIDEQTNRKSIQEGTERFPTQKA